MTIAISNVHRIAIALMLVLATTPSASADKVQLLSKNGGSTIVDGEVMDLTGTQIVVRTASGREQSYPAERVGEIETDWPAGYREGQASLGAGDYRKAVEQLTAAAGGDQRVWVRRLAMTDLLRAYANLGDWNRSAQLLTQLAASDAATAALDFAPLAWFSVDGVPATSIERWLTEPKNQSEQLLGASHALSTRLRPQAIAQLKGLRASGDARIAFYAQAQLWRTELVTASAEEVAKWEGATRKAPVTVRAGAWLVIGDAWSRLGETDRAALAYLRVPVEHGGRDQLAARALLLAAQVTTKADHAAEAKVMLEELVAKYPHTPPAEVGRGMLQSPGSN